MQPEAVVREVVVRQLVVRELVVREVAVREVVDLRWRVLRAGRPRESATVEGDDDPTTVVLAAFVAGPGADPATASTPVSTATLVTDPCPWRPEAPARRLRAMATDEAARGLGVGSAVLAEAIHRARAAGAVLLWCHARAAAAEFYRRAGFAVDGDLFDVAGVGPHLRMFLELV